MVQKIKSSNIDADVLTGNTELAEAANNSDTVLVHDTSAGALKKIQVSNLTAQAGAGLSKTNSTLAVDINGATALSDVASSDTILVYDASAGAIRKITQTNFLNFPTISSVSPTNLTSGDGTGNYTIVITGTGFTGATGSLVGNDGTSYSFDSHTVDSATQITGVIAKSSLPGTNEPFDIKVTAASGLASTLANQINIDAQPIFSTAAGSLGTVANGARSGLSFTVAAADPESGGDVVYTLESGSIPAGLSFSSTSSGAVISGDADAQSSNTTSNFTIRAKDVNSNTSDRAFSITVLAPQSQSFTSSGTFSVPSGISAVDVLVVAGGAGGGGGSQAGGGGGAGGLIYRPGFTVTPGGTVSVTVGDGGAAGPGQPAPTGKGGTGQDSVFGTLTAKGGGGGGIHPEGGPQAHGNDGGSGGGGGARAGAPGGTATQPTQSGESGNYGFGSNGGSSKPESSPSLDAAGGGGGAGGAGGNGQNDPGRSGDGGIGKAYTIADGTTSVYYAGGGAGGIDYCGPGARNGGGAGGQGGGGNGGHNPNNPGQAGTANRGGGGGGSGTCGQSTHTAGAGGKGIVIVRY